MLWLHLEFPLLPLEVFTHDLPANQRPLVISERQLVLRANATALACGVAAGISIATARALCPQLHAIERQPGHEARALLELADWSCGFTSLSSLVPPAGLLLEIGASLRLFGGLAALLAQVEEQLQRRGYTHASGLAPTPGAAGLFARASPCTHATVPRWCVDGDRQAFLARLGELPLELLDLPRSARQRLDKMGFRRIGDLLQLPQAALGRRFGADLLHHLARLSGTLPDPRNAYRPRSIFVAERQFPEPLHHVTALLFPMQRMLHELGDFLARHQAHCQRLQWQLDDISGRRSELMLACSLRHHDHAALLELTRLRLEDFRIAEPVNSLTLLCRDFSPTEADAPTLFGDNDTAAAPDAAARLVDRLVLRLGSTHVRGLALADAHLPEQAWHDPRNDARAAPAAPVPLPRPAWLLHEPRLLTENSRQLYCEGRLQLLHGPERIETGWWQQEVRRDYFVARREHDGALCWIFRNREDGRWFLQGFFG